MSSALRRLAARAGILDGYTDQQGNWQELRHDTCVALLAALGLPAANDTDATELMAELERRTREAALEKCRVVRMGSSEHDSSEVHLLPSERGGFRWKATIRSADAEHSDPALTVLEGEERPTGTDGVHRIHLPLPREAGWYDVSLLLTSAGRERRGTQKLALVPHACHAPQTERTWGVVANLYTVRSGENWGCGDLADLRSLLEATARAGGDFAGMNPLHALRNRGHEISPYSPVSRLFRNSIYLRVNEIPEFEHCTEARELFASASVQQELGRLRSADHVDYEGVAALQDRLLRVLHHSFRARQAASPDDRRVAEYAAYVHEMGRSLEDFATFRALDEQIAGQQGHYSWFRDWQNGLADARSREVALARESLGDQLDFHRWVQFELDCQLQRASRGAADAGMRTGLYQDLAIASSGGGSDAWAFAGTFAENVSIGAPPDPLATQGQDWGMPPLNPLKLRDRGYEYWRLLLRSSFRHAGALRIDHVLGLVRQFWIPHGMDGHEGAYVRFPSADMMGILALESSRAAAVVVGEDLGTVPPEIPGLLAEWGVLSSRVLYFERTEGGGYKSRHDYPREALTTANTHDLAPLAGFWRGRDLDIRESIGLLTGELAGEARVLRAADRELLLDRLVMDGCLDESTRGMLEADGRTAPADTPVPRELIQAVHRFLRGTPSHMVGLSLDDLAFEQEPVNVPGVSQEDYPSWTRKLRLPLDAILGASARHGEARFGGDSAPFGHGGP